MKNAVENGEMNTVTQHKNWELCPTDVGEKPEGDGWMLWKRVDRTDKGGYRYVDPNAAKENPVGLLWRRKMKQRPEDSDILAIKIMQAQRIYDNFQEEHPEVLWDVSESNRQRIKAMLDLPPGQRIDLSSLSESDKALIRKYLEQYGWIRDWVKEQLQISEIPEFSPLGLFFLLPGIGAGLAWMRSRSTK
ncbi:MAG: hypothetical protein GF408_07260 [Candidatus Omnitrophica bacterium]|nr:hypothetical protein [Candidatus Omnitrophota bacterium]